MLPSDYSSGRLSWEDGDGFEFSVDVRGDIHTVRGVSDLNGGGAVRKRYVAAYSGDWPDDVRGGVVVTCSQEVGSIVGMTLTLGSGAGVSGDLVFRSGLFRPGVEVEVAFGESEFWYEVGSGVVGDGTYTLRYTTKESAVGGVGGVTHVVGVEVRVGGISGVGTVQQEVQQALDTGDFGARHARWERVWADGTREVISDSYDGGYLPLAYREEWVSSRDRGRCHYECILWGFELEVEGVLRPVEDYFGGLELGNLYSPEFPRTVSAWTTLLEGMILGEVVDPFPWSVCDFNPAYCYTDVGVSGVDAGYCRVVYGLDTLWGWSTDAFKGSRRGGALTCWGVHPTEAGGVLGLRWSGWDDSRKGKLGEVRYYNGVKSFYPCFSFKGNTATDFGGGYELHGYGGPLENGNFDNGYVVLDVDRESGGLDCRPVDLELIRHGRRVWSTGAEEVFDGVVAPSQYVVTAGVSDAFEYCVEDVGGWRVSAKGAGCMHEYVGDMVYRDSYGLTVSVGGVNVAKLGVLKKGCGLSGLLHVGVSTTSGVYGFLSSMWFRVPGWSLDKAQRSGVRVRVSGRWFPVDGYVSMMNGDSVMQVDPVYRYNLVSLEERMIGLYSAVPGECGLLSGGYGGGDVVAAGWINPRGFNGTRMDVVYVFDRQMGAVASVSCGGGFLAAGGSDWTVDGVRKACSSWVDLPGAIVVAWN